MALHFIKVCTSRSLTKLKLAVLVPWQLNACKCGQSVCQMNKCEYKYLKERSSVSFLYWKCPGSHMSLRRVAESHGGTLFIIPPALLYIHLPGSQHNCAVWSTAIRHVLYEVWTNLRGFILFTSPPSRALSPPAPKAADSGWCVAKGCIAPDVTADDTAPQHQRAVLFNDVPQLSACTIFISWSWALRDIVQIYISNGRGTISKTTSKVGDWFMVFLILHRHICHLLPRLRCLHKLVD